MNDSLHIRKCLKLIEKKYGADPSSVWTNKDYTAISDEIEEVSKIRISPDTLKRLFGKISYSGAHKPQSATREALAIYLGFKSWSEFVKSNKQKSKHKFLLPINIDFSRRKIIITILVLAAIPSLFLSIKNFSKKEFTGAEVKFKFENPVGKAPHTVKLHYDLTNVKSDKIHIDFDYFSNNGEYMVFPISSKQGVYNRCYHLPGLYEARLFVDEKLITSRRLLVNSSNWFTYAIDAKRLISEVPEFIRPHVEGQLEYIKFDDIISTDVIRNGVLHVPISAIENIASLSANYNVHHKYIQPIDASLDSCIFSVRFRNEKYGQGLNCHEATFKLFGSEGSISFRIVEPGCSNYALFIAGKKAIFGQTTDMQNFEVNFKDFITLEMKVQNKHIQLFADNQIFYETDYKENLGQAYGFHFFTKEASTYDWLTLKTLDGSVAFEENFDE